MSQAIKKPKRKPQNGRPKLSDFRPQRQNVNIGKLHGLAALDKSIRRDGYSAPMVAAADGEIFAGSKRLERVADVMPDAAPIVVHSRGDRPVIHVRDDIPTADDPRAKRLGVADNVIAAMDWNPDGEMLAALAGEDAAIAELARQENASLKALAEYGAMQEMADAGPQIDRAEELNKVWKVKRGDLWHIGEHRLLCGDSTVRADVERVMDGERADTLVTDPPYGIGYKYREYDDRSNSDSLDLVRAVFLMSPEAKVWTCGLMNLSRDLEWNDKAKVLCWHKGYAQAGNGIGGASTWEPVLVVGVKNGSLPNDYLSFPTDRIPGLRANHPCPKPVALFAHLINFLAGPVVYEPFCGSGTTLVACENLHRRGRGIEISPAYCAVTLERMATAFPGIEIERVTP